MTPKDSNKNAAKPARSTVAEEIAVELSRLTRVAKSNDFQFLAYLIDMAVLEAWREAGGNGEGAPALNDLEGACGST